MKGTFFSKPLEWNLETKGESWQQGESISGTLRLRNHGTETAVLTNSGVAFALADIKKVQTRTPGALKVEASCGFIETELPPGKETELNFSFPIGSNSSVTDKKVSYYLAFGKDFSESQLQVKVEPKALYLRVTGLLDTFHRFKVKEYKAAKTGVEFKLIPPTSRELANVESLLLTFSMSGEELKMRYEFQVKKLDTSSVTTKVNKETLTLERTLAPKEYSLGRDLINQDGLLKSLESALSEVKLKNVF